MAEFENKTPNPLIHFCYEIVFMMLLRMPPKFLLKMKSICSMWRDIISDPYFIKAHLDEANAIHNMRLKRYMNVAYLESVGLEDEETRREHTIPVVKLSPHAEILGSCNGLLLIGDKQSTFYLWNPSTRLLREFNGRYIFKGQLRNTALGFDPTTSSYKVVRIVRVASPCSDSYHYDATSVHMYNCKTDCWKKIEDFPYVIFEDARGVTMNGFPHWIMFRNHLGPDNIRDLVIVYFDLVEEKFKEIPSPEWLVHSSDYQFGAFQGQLCFIRFTNEQNEVWIMQKHGESWVNLSSVVKIRSVIIPGWSSGHRSTYVNSGAFNGAQYVESLVSPFGGIDMIG